MKKQHFALTFLMLFALTFNAYASERSVKNYREQFCKEKPTAELQQKHDRLKVTIDEMLKKGREACSQEGRQAFSDCKSYRYGKVRKKLHKNKVMFKAIGRELESRKTP